jgi:hypothetical protein
MRTFDVQEHKNRLGKTLMAGMGMDDEVKQAQKALTLCPSGPADSVIAGPRDTD